MGMLCSNVWSNRVQKYHLLIWSTVKYLSVYILPCSGVTMCLTLCLCSNTGVVIFMYQASTEKTRHTSLHSHTSVVSNICILWGVENTF